MLLLLLSLGPCLQLILAAAPPPPPTVHEDAVFAVNTTTGVVYGQALYCTAANFTQRNCSTVQLTLDILRPVVNASLNVPLPKSLMPVMLGIHGGSYTHGDSTEEHPNAAFFVQRGWLGISINYRLCNQHPYPPATRLGRASSGGNLVCSQFGTFPAAPPFGNATCSAAEGVKTFGLGTYDGCPLSSPPKIQPNSTGHGRPGSFFGTLMAWMYPAMRDAKAAVRWLRAHAADLQISPEHITAIGGSAGACSVVGLATTFEDECAACRVAVVCELA
eukprot:COSAG01_NODE_2435_length_7701_cov_7.604709_10_plen_275_part_00